jgi:uncharacterized protein DUF6064
VTEAPLTVARIEDEPTMSEPDPLLALFAEYNPAIWPIQLVAYVAAALLIGLVIVRPSRLADRLVSGFLAAVWLFIGMVFHAQFVREMDATQSVINAAAFVGQGVLLLAFGVASDRIAYRPARTVSSMLGWAAIGYALVVYPLIGIALGHPYPQAPLFGAAPCPTTIVSFGLLLLARPPLPKVLLIVPLAWAFVATPAAVGRGILEDVALLGVALVAVAVIVARDRRPVRRRASTAGAATPDAIGVG